MGALVAVVLAIGAGAGIGALVGSRSTRHLIASNRERLARSTVVLLGGAAGSLIAAQLDLLVRQLEADAPQAASFGLGSLADKLDALAVGETLRAILLYGGALSGLAAIVALLASRPRRS